MANGEADLQHDMCLKDIPKLLGSTERRFLRVLAFMAVTVALLLCLLVVAVPDGAPEKPAVMQAAIATRPTPTPLKPTKKTKLVLQAKEDTGTKSTKGKTAAGKGGAPYVEGSAEDAGAYLRWILSRGGKLVLTKGFHPVAMLDVSLSVYQVPEGFLLPAEARNVTAELNSLMDPLPKEATLALLIWPRQLETKFEQELIALSKEHHAARLRARYVLRKGKLEIRIQEALVNGNWVPLRARIVI